MLKDIVKQTILDFREHDCFHLAANISFYAILSLLPITMLLVSAAGILLGRSDELFNQILETVSTSFPSVISNSIVANLKDAVSASSSLGGMGVLCLFFISTMLFSSIEHSLDKVFQSVSKRNFFHSKMLAVAFVFGMMLFFSIPTGVSLFERIVSEYGYNFPMSKYITARLYTFIFAYVVFFITITVIPNKRIYHRCAAVGALIFALGVFIAKHIFSWYLRFSFERYNIIYGSLTAVVLLVIWIYYVALILLLVSEFVSVLQKMRCAK